MKEINALTIADDLVEFLVHQRGHLARVHSIFPHAVNLLISADELITLTNQDEITPMGLIVYSSKSFTNHLQPGDEVELDVDCFETTNGVFSVNLQEAKVWETNMAANLDPRPVDEVAQINLQLTKWLAKQPALGLLPLLQLLTNQAIVPDPTNDNIYSRYIADDLKAFTKAVATSEFDLTLNLADRLVGFGLGSTPSCDDFLAAYLLIFRLAEEVNPGYYEWVQEFNKAIADKAKKSTTLISANMLRHAGNGKVSRSHQRLIQFCLYNNTGDLAQLASQVLHYGATSGGDFLLGLVCALAWYQNSMMYIPKKGEDAWVELKQSQPMPII